MASFKSRVFVAAKVGSAFYDALAAEMGDMAERLDANPWALAHPVLATTTTKFDQRRVNSTVPNCIAKLDENAEMVDFAELLASKGFTNGAVIERKQDGHRFTIVATSPKDVSILPEEGEKKARTTILANLCLDRYKLASAPLQARISGSELGGVCATANPYFRWGVAASYAKIALCLLEQELKPMMKVAVVTSPMNARKVLAEQQVANGVLMFAPCSSTVVKSVQSKTNATVAVTIKVDVFRETHELVVLPKVVVDPKGSNMICPFWFVRSTEHVQLANVIMAPHVVKV